MWVWLARPDRWEAYYRNVRRVRHLGGPWPELALGSRFSWTTFNVPVTTEVTDCEPFGRLAWSAQGRGLRAHHVWLLTSCEDGGTEIYTQETQHGAVPRLLWPVILPAMRRMHQQWVDGLSEIAATGRQP
ncbi:hypothetical protein AWC25_14930 [Mycobacterium sherrisii]|uniref:Polyketide cyclase n=1 Tax=Mycobacterium sherrisii TaxID=243061 RepID=A0A1E3T5W8_9MYCO|nr:hypothetical protein [Mycobacterium sherrisii]ODR09780.1 hypothetical protein BHQ21_03540 [Mycobacterium sherrisii]ORW75075.1 hypothetical protein AWC25_14930 [Mycobacterium sherrisii]